MYNADVIKKINISTAEISLCSDGIIRVMFKKGSEINPKAFKELFEKYNELVGTTKYPFIYSVEDDNVTFTSEGRAYSKQHEHSFPKVCNAYVVNSVATRLTANFYLKFNKPSYPSKLFNNQADAQKWCIEQLKKSTILK